MEQNSVEKTVELFNNKAGHDKIYVIKLVDEGDGRASVTGYNSRRGQRPTAQIKAANVPLQQALAKFEEVLREKLSPKHGYELAPGNNHNHVAPNGTNSAKVCADFSAELPKDAPLEALERFIRDDKYTFERKRDGCNLSIRKVGERRYQGINKNGQIVSVDARLAQALDYVALPTFLACGELEPGDRGWFCWDITEVNQTDLRDYSLSDRRRILREFFHQAHQFIHVVDFHEGETAKRAFVTHLHSIRAEGIVAKLNTIFRSGESGNSFKIKFVANTDVIVGPKEAKKQKDGKRSFGMYAFAGERLRYLGSCGCPDKYDLPVDGQVVQVKYLYLHGGPDGHLIQAKFFGVVRNDKDASDCVVSTMKLKAVE